MRCPPLRTLAICALLLASSSGCLFVRHSTRVVRDKETPRAVQFESDAARNQFESGLAEIKPQVSNADNPQITAVPLLFWYSTTDKLSDTAVRNDQLLICDANGDGFITAQEAAAYHTNAQSQASIAAAKKSERAEPSIARNPEDHVPPGIIVK